MTANRAVGEHLAHAIETATDPDGTRYCTAAYDRFFGLDTDTLASVRESLGVDVSADKYSAQAYDAMFGGPATATVQGLNPQQAHHLADTARLAIATMRTPAQGRSSASAQAARVVEAITQQAISAGIDGTEYEYRLAEAITRETGSGSAPATSGSTDPQITAWEYDAVFGAQQRTRATGTARTAPATRRPAVVRETGRGGAL